MKRYFILASILLSILSLQAKPKQDMDAFITSLMQRMTLHEKIGQLNLLPTGPITTAYGQNDEILDDIRRGEVGAVFNLKGIHDQRIAQDLAVKETRLGIPLIFGMDIIHGYETIFPQPLAMACSWDMQAIERMARVSALEGTADGQMWTFSPMVDVSKDARWSRIVEGAGEDPFLGAQIARAMVRGYQGNAVKNGRYATDEMMACVKHFALYGAVEGGRDYNTVDMSENRMRNEYFEPYRAAVDEGAASIMMAFNDINGVPCTMNRWLIDDVLRKEWGFRGIVTSDHSGVDELINHSMGNSEQVSAMALKAGVDFDMHGPYMRELEKAVKDGLVSEADIDRACRRILEAKWKLGLFDDPYRYMDEKRAKENVYNKVYRDEARRISPETFVLLKNDSNLLPLKKQGRIALIGPFANSRTQMQGTWAVAARAEKYKTILEVMQEALKGKAEVRYAKGSNFFYSKQMEDWTWVRDWELPHQDDKQLLDEALELARWSDVIVTTLGEPAELSGEGVCRTNLEMPDAQRDLLHALAKLGKPIVLLHFSGRPTVLSWEKANIPAIMNVWFAGSETADAITDVLFGDAAPSGHLTTSFPQTAGQEPFYYNHRMTSRPQDPKTWFTKFRSNYIDVSNDPVYPFGYGLTYTTFSYGKPVLNGNRLSVTVTNTGSREGTDVVQLYIRDLVASITRPVQELKGFERITLQPGEARTVTFTITPDLLKFWNADLKEVVEPGDFELMIGPNCQDVQKVTYTVK